MSGSRIVLLTGNALRHRFAANRLALATGLVGVVSEPKPPAAIDEELLAAADREVIQRHLTERDRVERVLFGENEAFPGTPLLESGPGGINSQAAFEWVRSLRPDLVLLFGTSIVRPPLLTSFSGQLLNLHLGLSPYYRGSATNFWPLVNREPACVGATIHLATPEVDAGAVLAQCRPIPEPTDGAHELGSKALRAALGLLPVVAAGYLEGHLTPWPQDLRLGRVYRRRDFSAAAVRQLWANLETGMMRQYVDGFDAACAQYPIHEPPSGGARETRAPAYH